MLSQLLNYDSGSGHLSWKVDRKNGTSRAGDRAGYKHRTGYLELEVNGKSFLAHRVCWLLHFGTMPEGQVDHINGIRDDNRISNLRVVANRTNSQNRKCHREGKLVGACFVPRKKKYLSSIRISGKNVSLGYYLTEKEAHNMYVLALKNIEIASTMTMPAYRAYLKKLAGV